MRKLGLVIGSACLFLLLAFTCSFAQMDMEKEREVVVKVMGDEMSMKGGCGGHKGGMEHQMGGSGGGGGCSKMGFFLCCKKELELTDKQVTDLKAIKMDFQKGKIRKEADLKIAQLELKGLMHDDDAPIKDMEAKMKAAAKLKVDMKLSHIKAFRKAKGLMTPEQLEKIKKCCGM
jgi:Spy/CpxP family protein refolding chaperone